MPWTGSGRTAAPPASRPRQHLARSLLATPWFAAGAGIVIAAVLAVESPTALTYGPTFPVEQCPIQGCGGDSGPSAGQPATATPGVAQEAPGLRIKGGATAPSRRRARAARGALLTYQIVRQWSSGFLAQISLPDAAKSGDWSLRFAFRAAHVDRVWGARWRPSGNGDRGTAYGPARSSGDFRGDGGSDPGQLMVSASGTPQAPSDCALDGARCRFAWHPSPTDG
jgi:Cellulose binding domain